jgi:hypothetical protein
MARLIFTMIFTVFLALICSISVHPEQTNKFDLRSLAGEWEGDGDILIPKISISVSIKGKAVFAYDSLTRRLRTSLEASRFLLSYADSGYLYHDPTTDSINWEVWDGFG